MESVNKSNAARGNFLPGYAFRSGLPSERVRSNAMRLARRLLVPITLLAALVGASAFLVEESHANLENGVFTSAPHRLRLVVPRGWRATEQPSYPGLLLWMMRSQPQGTIVLTAETFTRDLYCTWPIACRTSSESLASKYACALRAKLTGQSMRVGPTQAGPKDNEAAGLPSVWFEYDDGRRFLRQAVAIGEGRAISLVLAAPTNDARASHVRPFEQALRTLRTIVPDEPAPSPAAAIDAGTTDASTTLTGDAGIDGGAMFESAPAPTINPVGPCPS